ncbi:hypothetical protein [Viridibacillus arvi]|uniref:hypothetical protein n=1 Tax=Viridibacillus arvi TaxID=263475 RepID=UPI0034CD036C
MYKITFFMELSPKELEEKLLPVGFKKLNAALIWGSEDTMFKIVPFGSDNHSTSHGYRLYFNGSITGALYLYDMGLNMFKPHISGVEYNITEIERTQQAWNFYFKSRTAYKIIDERGIYSKGNVGIVCVQDNLLNLQVRPTRPKGEVSLNRSLEEIATLIEEINPTTMDLFSFSEVV